MVPFTHLSRHDPSDDPLILAASQLSPAGLEVVSKQLRVNNASGSGRFPKSSNHYASRKSGTRVTPSLSNMERIFDCVCCGDVSLELLTRWNEMLKEYQTRVQVRHTAVAMFRSNRVSSTRLQDQQSLCHLPSRSPILCSNQANRMKYDCTISRA